MQRIALISQRNDFSLIPLGKMCYLMGELQIYVINPKFENFESTPSL